MTWGMYLRGSLTLAVLEAFASALAPVLLRFLFARIARQETVLTQRVLERFVDGEQRAGDAVPHRTGLPRDSAAFRLHAHVETRRAGRGLQRLANDLHQLRAGKVLFGRLAVHGDHALTERQLHAR